MGHYLDRSSSNRIVEKNTENPTLVFYYSTSCPLCDKILSGIKSLYAGSGARLICEDVDKTHNPDIIGTPAVLVIPPNSYESPKLLYGSNILDSLANWSKA